VPAASRESIMPSPSSSLPLLHFGAGGGSVAQLPTVSCSSATCVRCGRGEQVHGQGQESRAKDGQHVRDGTVAPAAPHRGNA